MEFTQILSSFSKFFPASEVIEKKSIAMTVMILSPHPDDECITGSLALRLMQENNAHIVNVAVTLGSNKQRQPERLNELQDACELMGMELVVLDESWAMKAKELKSLIQKYAPSLIIAPHLKDHHPTHVKTGELLRKTLGGLKKQNLIVAWSEFWSPLSRPNILIEVPESIVALQMTALSKHVGEVARNPYHLRLPAWMIDNVRRGSEIVSGKGTVAPNFAFGVLYQIQLLKSGKLTTPKLKDYVFDHKSDLTLIIR